MTSVEKKRKEKKMIV